MSSSSRIKYLPNDRAHVTFTHRSKTLAFGENGRKLRRSFWLITSDSYKASQRFELIPHFLCLPFH